MNEYQTLEKKKTYMKVCNKTMQLHKCGRRKHKVIQKFLFSYKALRICNTQYYTANYVLYVSLIHKLYLEFTHLSDHVIRTCPDVMLYMVTPLTWSGS